MKKPFFSCRNTISLHQGLVLHLFCNRTMPVDANLLLLEMLVKVGENDKMNDEMPGVIYYFYQNKDGASFLPISGCIIIFNHHLI